MKFRILYTSFGLGSLALLFLSNITGAPGDYTGSPFSTGGNTFCTECHTGGTFNSNTQVNLLDSGTPITEYEPGKTYKLQINVAVGSGSPAGYGFQTVALGPSNANAGTFGTNPSDTRFNVQGGRRYFGHNMVRNTPLVEIDWTAPVAGTGAVTFYAAGNAVNGNNNSTGDSPSRTTKMFAEKVISNINTPAVQAFQMQLLENPVSDAVRLHVRGNTGGDFRFVFYDISGKPLCQENISLAAGETMLQIPADNIETGVYFLRADDGRNSTTLKLLKQ